VEPVRVMQHAAMHCSTCMRAGQCAGSAMESLHARSAYVECQTTVACMRAWLASTVPIMQPAAFGIRHQECISGGVWCLAWHVCLEFSMHTQSHENTVQCSSEHHSSKCSGRPSIMLCGHCHGLVGCIIPRSGWLHRQVAMCMGRLRRASSCPRSLSCPRSFLVMRTS
jgi:hypothetical protein